MTTIMQACSGTLGLLVLLNCDQSSYQRTTFHYLLCPT